MKHKILSIIAGVMLAITAAWAQDSNNSQLKNDDKAAVNTDNQTPTKIAEYIVGTWTSDNSKQDNNYLKSSGENEMIEFDREARYMIKSRNQVIERGSYRMNENHSIIYLESESSEKPQEFNVSFKQDQMTLTMRPDHEQGRTMSYVYTRTSPATERVDKSGNAGGKN